MSSVEYVTDPDSIADGVQRWNDHVTDFAVDDRLLRQNVYAPFDSVDVRCFGVRDGGELRAFAVVKRLHDPAGTFDATETAWLSLFAFDPASEDGRAACETLLQGVAEDVRSAGASKLVVGRSPQRFLAGVPDALPDAYVEALEAVGFTFGEAVYDLQREISGYEMPADCVATGREWPALDVVRATGREGLLQDFLREQFPGPWPYEAANICAIPGGPADYFLLTFEGDPVGFLRSNRHDGAYRGANCNWGWRLSNEYCGVGPLGVHEDYRGRGWGLYLITTVLERLAADGYDHCVIDWTDLPAYYEQLGFDRWIRYRNATLDLAAAVEK